MPRTLQLIAFLLLVTTAAWARTNIQIISVHGRAEISIDQGKKWSKAATGKSIPENAVLKTATNSLIDLRFGNAAAIRLTQNSELQIECFRVEGDDVEIQLDLKKGKLLGIVDDLSAPSKIEINSPVAVYGVRGRRPAFEVNSSGFLQVESGVVIPIYFKATGMLIPPMTVGPGQFSSWQGIQRNISPILFRNSADAERGELTSELEAFRAVLLERQGPELIRGRAKISTDNGKTWRKYSKTRPLPSPALLKTEKKSAVDLEFFSGRVRLEPNAILKIVTNRRFLKRPETELELLDGRALVGTSKVPSASSFKIRSRDGLFEPNPNIENQFEVSAGGDIRCLRGHIKSSYVRHGVQFPALLVQGGQRFNGTSAFRVPDDDLGNLQGLTASELDSLKAEFAGFAIKPDPAHKKGANQDFAGAD